MYSPGKSVNVLFVAPEELVPIRASTVLPGKFEVALRKPQNLLNSVVFPTFGLPNNNTELVALGCDLVFCISLTLRYKQYSGEL